MAKQATTDSKVSLIKSLQSNPVWSPDLQTAVDGVREMREDFDDYIKRIFRNSRSKTSRRQHGIIKGAPGTGKSYTISQLASKAGLREGRVSDRGRYDYTIIKGSVTAAKLHITLYYHRKPGKILILDDCKNAEHDLDCLTALNGAMDTHNATVTRDRIGLLRDEGTGDIIPNQFKFQGNIIIVSNIFGDNARVGGTRAVRFNSIMSRCQPFEVGNGDRQDLMAHILDLADNGELVKDLFPAVTDQQLREVFTWAVARLNQFREVSIRHILELIDLRCDNNLKDWTRLARRVMLSTTEELGA